MSATKAALLLVVGRGVVAVVAVAAVVTAVACTAPPAPSTFGALCTVSSECGPLMCRPDPAEGLRRCLPPRLPSEAGESCTLPLAARPRGDDGVDDVVVDEEVFFGAAIDDGDIACGIGGQPDVVIRFTLTARAGDGPETPQGISIRADNGVAVALRSASCGSDVRFGCAAPGQTALLASVPPGDYELVVDGQPPAIGEVTEVGTRVIVQRLDCPTGGLPFDETRCLRTAPLPPLLTPRVDHTAHVLSTGAIAVLGGFNGFDPLSSMELFDPTTVRWRFGDIGFPRRGHVSAVLDGTTVLVAGGTVSVNASIALVQTDLIDAPRVHAIIADGPRNLREGPRPTVIGLTANDRMLSLSNSFQETGIIDLRDSAPRRCSSNSGCRDGEACVTPVPAPTFGAPGVCVCAGNACGSFTTRYTVESLVTDPLTAQMREGVSGAVVGDRFAVVSGLAEDSLVTVDVRPEGGIIRLIDTAQRRQFAAVVPVDERLAWIIGGVDDEGVPLDLIEEVDLAFNTVRAMPFRLGRGVARPRAARLDDAVVVIDDSDLPQLVGLDGTPLTSPLIQARAGAVVVAVADAVVIIGGEDDKGISRLVERVELVSRRAPPPLPLPVCTVSPLPDDGVIAGNTRNSVDTFRTDRCDDYVFPFGRDDSYSFTVTEPSSVRLVDLVIDSNSTADSYRFFLLKGDCTAYEELACGDSDQSVSLFVPEIAPGDYTLVVDYAGFNTIFDEDYPHGGSPYEARVLLGPPMSCPADERDPADDDVTGAVFMGYDAALSFAELDGRLCPGDVDHIVVEHWGAFSSDLLSIGVPFDDINLHRAIVDEAASLAAGTIVVAGIVGPELDALEGQPPGHYVTRFEAAAGAVDFNEWTLQQQFNCEPDASDSLLTGLDNRNVGRAPHLSPGSTIELRQCSNGDVDLLILDPGEGADSFVILDAEPHLVTVFDVVDGALGPAHPFTTVDDGFDRRLELGVLTGPVALRLTLPAGDIIEAELDVTFGQRQVGDSCQTPLPLAVAAERSGTLVVDNTPFNDDHNAEQLGDCTGFRTPGNDVVYAVTLGAGETLDADVIGVGDTDVAIYLLDHCPVDPNDATACVVGADQGNRGQRDVITFTNVTAADQDLFLVVDSFFGESFSWNLAWSITRP